jgi:hypothetical protein
MDKLDVLDRVRTPGAQFTEDHGKAAMLLGRSLCCLVYVNLGTIKNM